MTTVLSEYELCLMAVACACFIKKKSKKRNKRSKWTKLWLLERNELSHVNLLNELKLEPSDWCNYLRMDEETYMELLNLLTPIIERKDSCMRRAITPHERLTATLRFLATGRSYEEISVIISPQALGQIIPETCSAIYSALKDSYIKFAKTVAEWRRIAYQFEEQWNFPHCLGAVDGKHLRINPPAGSGSYFWNYKGYNSLVLMAIANANYEFIMCDFDTNGRISDGGVVENTPFYSKFKHGTLSLPSPSNTSNSQEQLPFVFIGDEAFAVRSDFLKPYSQKVLDHDRKIFNYRLSRARRIVENTFGIMAARFRIFHTAIGINLEAIDKVVMACCYLTRKCGESYTPTDCFDNEDLENSRLQLGLRPEPGTLLELQRGHNRRAGYEAQRTRELYLEYFNQEGAILWQEQMI